jgi:ABC-type phosphate transport system auxiliary subunit
LLTLTSLTISYVGALRSLISETEVEGSPTPEEIQKRAEELNQLTQEQAKQLEDVRQVEFLTAQLEEQSKNHEELKLDLEAERNERLKSEAKLIVLNEVLPNMEEKLKNLSNQVLFLEGEDTAYYAIRGAG